MEVNIGAWLSRQRVCHQPDAVHPLDERQTELLDALGMDWEIHRRDWETCFAHAEHYFAEHGDLLVPFYYRTDDGVGLGKWITSQRMKKKGTAKTKLSEEQIARLDKIGMVWDLEGKRSKRGGARNKGKQ